MENKPLIIFEEAWAWIGRNPRAFLSVIIVSTLLAAAFKGWRDVEVDRDTLALLIVFCTFSLLAIAMLPRRCR